MLRIENRSQSARSWPTYGQKNTSSERNDNGGLGTTGRSRRLAIGLPAGAAAARHGGEGGRERLRDLLRVAVGNADEDHVHDHQLGHPAGHRSVPESGLPGGGGEHGVRDLGERRFREVGYR